MTSAMHDAGQPRPVSGTAQKDGEGREVGGGFRMGGHVYTCGRFMLMYGRNHHNIVIILQFKLID